MRSDSIKVLDHGYVGLLDHMGDDLSIARAARVVPDAEWRGNDQSDSDEIFIRYLWANGYTAPFETVEFQFEVKVPVFVFQEWCVSRLWVFNQEWARFRHTPDHFYTPDLPVVEDQSPGVARPASSRCIACDAQELIDLLSSHYMSAHALHLRLLGEGWPQALAYSVLPTATYVTIFAKIDLHNLLRFLAIRYDRLASYEMRIYAEAMYDLIGRVVPVALKAWELISVRVP